MGQEYCDSLELAGSDPDDSLKDGPYYKQAELMLKAISHVAAERSFALKGGTAINLFVRDMPRLSVDIDLTYLPIHDARDVALRN